MKKVIAILALAMLPSFIGAAEVQVTVNSDKLKAYDIYEVSIPTDFGASNPYNYDLVNVQATMRSPEGRTFIIDGFYSSDFEYSFETNSYQQAASGFKVRFAPAKTGKWTCTVRAVKDGKQVFTWGPKPFTVAPDKTKKGFIKASRNDPLFLDFDNGTPFFGLGMNTAWPGSRGLMDYKDWFAKMSAAGMNLARVWMAPWSLGIEWDTQLGDYGARQKQAYMLDKVLELARDNNMYIMLCLVPHGELSAKTNPEWDKNPYNFKNDGLIDSPEQFFTNPAAKKAFKNRLRYILARWGSSDRVMAWELFNEVDLTDNYDPSAVSSWHAEMFDFIKSHDFYRHLLTTSFSRPVNEPEIWNLSQIDFTQTHIYGLKDEAVQVYDACKSKIESYAKPHIMGEYGIDAGPEFTNNGTDNSGIHVHNALWSGAFTLSLGAPMQWYWDNYVNVYNLYGVYTPLANFIKDIKWSSESFTDLNVRQAYLNKPAEKGGDVNIYPVDSWQKPQRNEFKLRPDGTVTNQDYLCGFLFGASKKEMQNDPVLIFSNELPVKLKVQVSKVSDDNELCLSTNGICLISVSVCAKDFPSKVFLEQYGIYQADIKKEYTVEVPPGDNEIILSNKGKDWIKIDQITVENFLSANLAPLFVSGIQSPDKAFMWIKNNEYSYRRPEPDPVQDCYIEVFDLRPGRYTVSFYDTYEGKFISSKDDIVEESVPLRIELPPIAKDIAIKVVKYKK